ncbi:MAG: RsbRD N-terminal domain-containing protein [Acidobacteriota bacterium]|nr:RsbRD N-terminal domain-containing protein [Acidobacteriota bacterium]
MGRFSSLFRQHLDRFARAWVDDVYAERRTDLATILSSREMVEHLPELFDELGYLLDERADADEIAQAAPRLRGLAQTRFQQGVLIDEVARELMLLRDALCEFLWEEGPFVVEGDVRELRAALRRTRLFCDELMAQAILVYAASLRPIVPTRGSVWPPPRRRKK